MVNDLTCSVQGENRAADAAHIAANSPEVTLAFIALAEADDPEPNREYWTAYSAEGIPLDRQYAESADWTAWRKRQELRANIDRVLGGGEE
jgi:hypothetical protein